MRPVSQERAYRTARNSSTQGASHATHFFERHYAGGGTAGGRGRGRRPTERTTHEVPVDAVVSGAGCMDKYEASVWRVPNPTTTNAALVRRIQQGRASQADLTA